MKQVFAATILALLMWACKKEEPKAEEPVTTGTLKGRVTRYDQFGAPYATNPGVTVRLAGRGQTAITGTEGDYAFENMSSGTYTLVFEKPGSGGGILQDLRYKFDDTVTYNASIADIPSFGIATAYVKDTTWFGGSLAGIYYNATAVPANSKASVVAIVGKSPALELGNPASYLNFGTASFISAQDYGRFLSYAFLSQSLKFKKDSTVYVKLYPVAANGAFYIDNQLNRPVYTAFGSAFPTTFTFTMPLGQ